MAVATLVAAFFGTFLAFLLESRRRSADLDKQHIAAINRALYALFHYWNISIHFRHDVIDPARGKPNAWLEASALVAPEQIQFPIDNGNLDFLLSVGDKASLFAALQLQQQRFEYVTFMMNEQTRCIRTAYRVLGERGTQRHAGLTEAQFNQVLGSDRVLELHILFDGLVIGLDEGIPAFEATFRQLTTAGKKLFPKANLIECEFVFKEDQHAAAAVTG